MPFEKPAPRIALIHALAESVAPAQAAFRDHWPAAYPFDLLDSALAVDLAESGRLDAPMMERFQTLADYAAGTVGKAGATAGILFTCSAFGPAIDQVKKRLSIPVLRPNESAFDAALDKGGRIGIVVSFGPSAPSLHSELLSMAADRGQAVQADVAVAEGALAALKAGDTATHDRIVLQAAESLRAANILILGQFSLARAQSLLQSRLNVPVLSTPVAAVEALRRRCLPFEKV